MTALPELRDLAAHRLRKHQCKYRLVVIDGQPVPFDRHPGWITYTDPSDGRLYEALPQHCEFVNAAMARNIPLDLLEEMADIWNGLGFELTKPDKNGEPISEEAQMEIRQLQQIAICFDYRLRRLWALLPESHREDRYAVERDEVTAE